MKRFMFRLGLWPFFLSLTFSLIANAENYRLFLTASTLATDNPSDAFYRSGLFLGDDAPFFITKADSLVYETDEAVFYSEDLSTLAEILSAKTLEKGRSTGFIGQSYRGFLLNGVSDDQIVRYLGADQKFYFYEKRQINQKIIYGFSKNEKAIVWPESEKELHQVPAVRITSLKNNSSYLACARALGGFSHRMGLLDKLLSQNIYSGFIDLGTSQRKASSISIPHVVAVKKRKPLSVSLGTLEMAVLMSDSKAFDGLSYIYPFGDNASKKIQLKTGEEVNFLSAAGKEKVWQFYSPLGEVTNVPSVISRIKDQKAPVNFIRVFSEEEAQKAARSPFVDLIFLVAKDPYEKFALRETIELKLNRSPSHEEAAPVVRVSSIDVTEVILSGSSLANLQKVVIQRHPITDDAPRATDVEVMGQPSSPGLPNSDVIFGADTRWTSDELNKVIGGIIVKSANANVALFEPIAISTEIKGAIPGELVKTLFERQGTISTVTLSGKQIKKILKVISKNQGLMIYGIDPSTSKIGGREIGDAERFKIALSERALLEVFGMSKMGGLNEDFFVRAPFVESIYSTLVTEIFFIGGPKQISLSDTAKDLEQAVRNKTLALSSQIAMEESLATMTDEEIRSLVIQPFGKPHHVLTFNISNFDIGFSKTVGNNTYTSYEKRLSMGRAKAKLATHLFLFSKMALVYDTPSLISSLSGDIKYIHTNTDEKPEKDKTRAVLRLRMPWERSLFAERPVVLSPIFEAGYETKLAPHLLSDHGKLPDRTKKLDTLLGFNVDFTKLGFSFDTGIGTVTDFNRKSYSDALDYGPVLNFTSRWSLGGPFELTSDVKSYYLFSLPQNNAKDKVALGVEGTVYLRLAQFHKFSVSWMTDFFIATLQEDPSRAAISSNFGLTISYGQLFRIFG